MLIAVGLLTLLVSLLLYRFFLVWPIAFLSWLHLPSWFVVGIIGGLVAWCLADD